MTEKEGEKSLKILVCGDVEGKLNDLYSKVKSIQAKAGKFDFLICVGEFFSDTEEGNSEIESYCSEPSSIPILTYFIGTNKKDNKKFFRDYSGYELVKDKIIYLGSKGIFTTTQGLSILYLSGVDEKKENKKLKKSSEDSADEKEPLTFNLSDIETLERNCEVRNLTECVDILITNQWPKHVEKLNDKPLENNHDSSKFGSELVSYLAMVTKPRYHFAAKQNFFFERIPYRNHEVLSEKEMHMSKFLGLSKVNKQNKPKSLYAFNIIPCKKMNYQELVRQAAATGHATDSPYKDRLTIKTENLKTKSKNNDDPSSSLQYFYDQEHIQKMNEINERALGEKKRRQEAKEKAELEPCWFCLGGSKVERHYIVSVGEKSYLAYAKGAINKDHLLIIPIDHVQSSVHADEKLLEDITKYKIAVTKYFESKNKCVLFFERNFRTKHMQIQVFAVKADKAYLLKDAFFSVGTEQNINLNEIPQFTNLKQVLRQNQSFFYLELPNEDLEESSSKLNNTRFLWEIRGNSFPLNFGRDVVASELLLNVPERVDWRECVMTQEEEKEMSIEFRNNFKKFDPFL